MRKALQRQTGAVPATLQGNKERGQVLFRLYSRIKRRIQLKSILRIALWTLAGFFVISAQAQTNPGNYVSTTVKVDIGVATKARFCFGPASSPCVGQTVVFVNYPDGFYQVVFNYATPSQQGSAAIPLTYTVTRSSDPDNDSNQFTSVVVNTAQSGTIGARTVTLVSASFQSEQVGSANRNETLGGSATLTIQ